MEVSAHAVNAACRDAERCMSLARSRVLQRHARTARATLCVHTYCV
jgi:hypothetical protein